MPQICAQMFKSVKNRLLRGVLFALCLALGLVLGFFLVVYLSVPAYRFKEPKPFEGAYLYNPYQDMQPELWKKYHFHCHSRKFFGLTNGRKSSEASIDSVYSALGYDHYGISDYMSINRHNADYEGYIPVYEHGYGLIRKTHQICIGAEKVWHFDYPFMQNIDIKQHTINKLSEHCRFVMPAHASFTKGYKVGEMKWLSNYRLLEILNPYGNAITHWDMALSHGHRVYGLGDDDTHNIHKTNEVCRHMTIINTANMKAESVYESLEKGLFYAVEFDNYYHFPMTLEEKALQVKSLPYLTQAELIGDTLIISTSAPSMKEVKFIGQGGTVLKTEENIATASYVIQPEDPYVRTQINVNGLQHFYLNPVTRHSSPTVIDQRLDVVNKAQTYLYRFVYIAALGAMIWYLFKKANAQKKESK